MQVWPLNVEVWQDGETSDIQRNVFVPSPSHFTGPELNTERIFHSAGSKGSVSFEPPLLSVSALWLTEIKTGPDQLTPFTLGLPITFCIDNRNAAIERSQRLLYSDQ